MKQVATLPEFASLTEEEIERALDQLDAAADADSTDELAVHPLLRELERLIAAYSERFEALCKERDEFPEELLTFEPDKPIEQIAYDIFSDALHDSLQEADEDE